VLSGKVIVYLVREHCTENQLIKKLHNICTITDWIKSYQLLIIVLQLESMAR